MNRKLVTKTAGLLAILLCGSMMMNGCGSSSDSTEITVADNQRLINVMVMSIDGNQISVREVETVAETDAAGSAAEDGAQTAGATGAEAGAPDGTADGSQAADSANDRGKRGGQRGEMPEGMSAPADGEMPEGMSAPADGETLADGETAAGGWSGKGGFGDMTLLEYQIPVGTTVHTNTGTTTTFARIAAGDTLQILLETDADGNEIPVEIWMK